MGQVVPWVYLQKSTLPEIEQSPLRTGLFILSED